MALPIMVVKLECPALGKAVLHLPFFYSLQLRSAPGSTTEIVIVRTDPETQEEKDWGRLDSINGAPHIMWLPGCPPPQHVVIPEPEPDLTNEDEFPTEQVLSTIEKLEAELYRRRLHSGPKITR